MKDFELRLETETNSNNYVVTLYDRSGYFPKCVKFIDREAAFNMFLLLDLQANYMNALEKFKTLI